MKPLFQIATALLLGLVVVAVIAFSPFIANYALVERVDHKFEQIQKDDSQGTVISLVGEPDSMGRCGENLWWGEGNLIGKNDGRCVTQARYKYLLSAWIVGYSANGHVVSKTHVISE